MIDWTLEKAKLFNVVANAVERLNSAWDKRQKWRAETKATQAANGEPDGGYEIHIIIDPPTDADASALGG